MNNRIFLASDLDRTIVPNGEQQESPNARPLLSMLANRPEVTLAYVSGRNKALVQQAMEEYDLPIPDFVVGDVGTTIYTVGIDQTWEMLPEWKQEIASDWNGYTWEDMVQLYSDIPEIRIQDDNPAFQGDYKTSYYTDPTINITPVLERMHTRAREHNLRLSIIFSIDERKQVGLLDILPESATKLHAIQFLMKKLDHSPENTVFAGDSGNDLPVVGSGLNMVLVKNAREDVKQKAISIAQEKGVENTLYIAKGNFIGLNGNYTAGVLEGLAHFLPNTAGWMEQ